MVGKQFSMGQSRTRPFIGALFACVLAVALPAIAPASVIYSNFGAGTSYDITTANPVGNAFDGNTYGEGATFTPSANFTFTGLKVALSCAVGCPASENFTISLRSNTSDSPGAAIESFIFTGTTLNALGLNNTPISATSIAHPTLSSGTQYWITVTSTIAFSIGWNLNSTGDSSDEALSFDGGASWFSPSGLTPGAYEVDGTALVTVLPEPGAGLLLCSGLLVVAVRKRFSARLK